MIHCRKVALLFARSHHDINIRGAFLHMTADAAVSGAVVFAGVVILWTGQKWVDPIMSLAVAIVILWGSVGLLKESVWMSLAAVPSGIDVDQVEIALAEIDVVDAVHDLHIWPISTTETALTAHLVSERANYPDELLASARQILHTAFTSNIAPFRSSDITRPITRTASERHASRMFADRRAI